MHSWIFFSLSAMVLVALFNLAIKRALNLKLSEEKVFFYWFVGCFVGFLAIDSTHIGGLIAGGRLPLLFVWGVVIALLSFTVNYLTAFAYQTAPNPGYVEGIKASNGIFTTIIGLIFLGTSVYWLKWIGIVIIPIGLFLFLREKSGKEKSGRWKLLSVLSTLAIALMFTGWGYMASTLKFSPVDILLALFFFGSIIFLGICLVRKSSWSLQEAWLPILLAIIFGIPANWFNIIGIEKYGSAGVPTSIYNTQAVLTTLLAGWIFPKEKGGEFDWKKLLAIAIILIGALFILLSPK